ncbi:MAG: glutamine-hydrolyzing GMP synthase [Legionellales bacterium]|jgi:GMP synthase (glutamine-hydrolysing)
MTKDVHSDRILILDFGSQYTQLIARRVRELGVFCEVHPFTTDAAKIKKFAPKGIILSGGPKTVTTASSPRAPEIVFELGCPVLGICYGMQTMAAQLGGQVLNSQKREYGSAQIILENHSELFSEIEDQVNADGQAILDVWMSHGDKVESLPSGFHCIAHSGNSPLAAMADEKRKFYGLQFHPEVSHTPQGARIFSKFVNHICGCEALWKAESIIENSIENIKQQVGSDAVILGLSGGVDSAVLAALLHRAIGEQLHCVLVDTGLLRLNEVENVLAIMQKNMGITVHCVDAKNTFYDGLKNVTDPEEKRKIIGRLFVESFEQHAKEIKNAKWLAQGTIYSDVIESAQAGLGGSHLIKSHHNVGGLPERMDLKLLEPLRELFKDEVRKIGLELGLPKDMVFNHPFPGPGLAVRILGEIKEEYILLLRRADAIFIEELRKSGWYEKVSQAFVVFMPVKSVAVMGDDRVYDYVVSLRAVQTQDFMTAHWAPLPYELLAQVSNRIINEVKGISRVTYDISSKPPATIEWE